MAFDTNQFIERIGHRLVLEFEHADVGGTPTLVGAAREHPARLQLESLLPRFLAVGSGIVFDSYGGVSKQQDIVIYERDYCPVFSVNGSSEATFYPVECVLAVGEVKSQIDASTLKDAFEKIKSCKALQRYSRLSQSELGGPDNVCFRKYGSGLSIQGTPDEQFDQKKPYDGVYGFLLANKFKNSAKNISSSAFEVWRNIPAQECVDLIVSLNEGFFQGATKPLSLSNSSVEATELVFCAEAKAGFSHLVASLILRSRMARTVELAALNRYMPDPGRSFTVHVLGSRNS